MTDLSKFEVVVGEYPRVNGRVFVTTHQAFVAALRAGCRTIILHSAKGEAAPGSYGMGDLLKQDVWTLFLDGQWVTTPTGGLLLFPSLEAAATYTV